MSAPAVLRFGSFELRAGAGELRHRGDLVKLAPQPLKVLELLMRRGGDVVTRAEIREHVWSGDTFVDFEQGLNFCIRQIREVLGDTADAPRFIETLPRRGYRFLMPVSAVTSAEAARVTRLIVLPFTMLRHDAGTEFLAFSLPDAVTSSLSGLESLVVRSSLVAARFAGQPMDPRKIAADADVDMIVTGTLLRAGDDIRVSTQLTEASAGTLLWAHTAQAAVGDLFKVQDELARLIVESLSVPLTTRDRQALEADMPSSKKAYEYFLRGNQLSLDTKQWNTARDLYERCVEEDPRYAPAWARLGRIRHVMAKYLEAGKQEELDRAEAAFRQALELSPELPLAQKLYAQFEADMGRARDAMLRLAGRAHCADPEIFAGLVSTCRYCGLLDASVAAHERAVSLEPRIRTSVPHTWFLQADHSRVAAIAIEDFPYIVPLSIAELGRPLEALAALRKLEETMKTRAPGFVIAARTLLEGNTTESVAAIGRIVATGFRDPEGLFYLSRHLAHLNESAAALDLLDRVVGGGFYCYPAMARDPWLDSLRKKPAFTKLLRRAEKQHGEAAAAFERLAGDTMFGAASA